MFPLVGDRYSLGFSNQVLAWVSVGGFTVIFIALGYLLLKIHPTETGVHNWRHPDDGALNVNLLEEYDDALLNADVSTLNRAQRRARAKLQMKKHRRLEAAAPRQNMLIQEPMDEADDNDVIHEIDGHNNQDLQQEDWNQEDENEREIEGGDGQIARYSSTLSRKERQRLAKVQEREERRMYEQMRREKSRVIDEALSREKREKEKAAWEEQERLAQQRKERMITEQERKRMMFVPHDNHSKDTSMTVEDFVKLLLEQKQISIDEMANRLSVSTNDIVDRIRQLEDEDRIPIPGIFDNSYAYYTVVAHDDMRSIITRLEESGPMSLSTFSEECQRLFRHIENKRANASKVD